VIDAYVTKQRTRAGNLKLAATPEVAPSGDEVPVAPGE
jgi:hypothetical protein